MKRRNFIKLSLASAAFALAARGGEPPEESAKRAGRDFRVGAQKDRYEEELLIMGGRFDLNFKQMSKLGKEIPKNQETIMKQVCADHGMEVVGPPLKF
jgi:hypothetical protein